MIELKITGEPEVVRGEMLRMLGIKVPVVTGTVPVDPPNALADATKTEPDKRASGRTRAKKAEEEAPRGISTGGERVDPATEKQDKADEAAETAATKTDAKKLTHDDVRAALGVYVKKFGMPAAQEDGPKVLTMCFGEGKSKVSDIPDMQDALEKAVKGIEEMTEKNPFKREAVKAA